MAKPKAEKPMSAADLVGRVVALEAFVVELAAMMIAPLPDDQEEAALQHAAKNAKGIAREIRHGEVVGHADGHLDRLTDTVRERLRELRGDGRVWPPQYGQGGGGGAV